MKIKDIRKLKGDEMEKKFAELKTELIKLQGQSATGTPPKSPGQIKQIKLALARINTVKRESELASMATPKKAEKEEEAKQVNARN